MNSEIRQTLEKAKQQISEYMLKTQKNEHSVFSAIDPKIPERYG